MGEDDPPARLAVRLLAADPVRRRRLAALVAASGHAVVAEGGDVLLADAADGAPDGAPHEADLPALALGGGAGEGFAGALPAGASARQLDAALRAVAAGLVVRAPEPAGFGPAEEAAAPLTRRELEILARLGEGLSNKAIARQLGISAHTVKFHLEAVFDKLSVASRAEAVAKGLRGGIIEM
jgi:DNA-binding CsgD family transcriptional regulator